MQRGIMRLLCLIQRGITLRLCVLRLKDVQEQGKTEEFILSVLDYNRAPEDLSVEVT
jgi:hypothetical protein